MKRLFACILVVLTFAGAFSACADKELPPRTTDEATIEEMTWPTFAPEDVKVRPGATFGFITDSLRHRFCYYDVPTCITDLTDAEKLGKAYRIIERMRSDGDLFIEPGEMGTVTFIKYCQIQKGNFVVALENHKQYVLEALATTGYTGGWDGEFVFDDEIRELPNPDIIYTFDNQVINAYYRRESPVEPDWSKVKTYESYEEYLKANP